MTKSKCDPIKKGEIEQVEIDIETVVFNEFDEYNPQIQYSGGGYKLNVGSKRREEWESDERLLDYLKILRSSGMTKKKIAKDKMGIDYTTLLRWEAESEPIKRALSTGVKELCEEIEGVMFRRAKGYEYEEVKTTILGDVRKGSKAVENQQTVRVEKSTKHQTGDTGAAIFMLTNLMPDKWRNRQRVDTAISGSLDTNVNLGEAVQIFIPDNSRDGVSGDGEAEKEVASEKGTGEDN